MNDHWLKNSHQNLSANYKLKNFPAQRKPERNRCKLPFLKKKIVLYSVLRGLWEAGGTGSPLLLIFSQILIKEVNIALYLKLQNCLCHRNNFFPHLKQALYGVLGSNLTFLVSVPLFHFLPVLICFSHLVGIFLLLAARWFHRLFVNRSHEIFPLLFQPV